MQYYSYQTSDGSIDYSPDGHGVWQQINEAFTNNNDYQIMLARTKAAKRGASPVEVQQAVASLTTASQNI